MQPFDSKKDKTFNMKIQFQGRKILYLISMACLQFPLAEFQLTKHIIITKIWQQNAELCDKKHKLSELHNKVSLDKIS